MTNKALPQYDTVIFDMDGLLIDSEPHWRQAELDVFCPLGVPLTEELCHLTTGLKCSEVVEYWYQRHPWQGPSQVDVQNQLELAVIHRIERFGEALPGVFPLLEALAQQGKTLAVASGSATRIIQAVLNKLDIAAYFKVCQSAEHEPLGKPHPGVYLSCMKKLGVKASQCIAFEDSARGMQAAQAAEIYTVVVPEPVNFHQPAFQHADLLLTSLTEFDRN